MFIRVVPYDPFWEVEYENESQKIKNILKDILVEVYHIGSTAVKGLAAKSIIDIMPVVTNISLVDKHNKEFVAIGYGSYNIVVFLTICISYANNCLTL